MKIREISPGHLSTDTGYYIKVNNVYGYREWTVYGPDDQIIETFREKWQAIERIRSDTDN